MLHFASLSNFIPFIPTIVSLASRTSLPWPYFAIVCHFRNTRRLNSVLNKHLECSRVLGISGTRVQPTRIGVREGRGKNWPRIAMKLESYSQNLIEQNTRPPPFGRGDYEFTVVTDRDMFRLICLRNLTPCWRPSARIESMCIKYSSLELKLRDLLAYSRRLVH